MQILIRDAELDDVALIAGCVMSAAHVCDFPTATGHDAEVASEHEAELMSICSSEGTLYSYRNARVITVDGTPVGCMISYAGDNYLRAREKTIAMIPGAPAEEFKKSDLDSLAVMPAYRRFGLGRMLVEDALHVGASRGCTRFSLIAEKASTHLHEFYSSLGFRGEREIMFFGDPYLRMVKQ